jgi:predicted O-methyltransferase YrrM
MRVDPFALKQKSKLNPIRIFATLRFRLDEQSARARFNDYAMPQKVSEMEGDASEIGWEDTAVTPLQMSQLLAGLRDTEKLAGTVVVEVGSYRGVTTQRLAGQTSRKFIAVDPFLNGYGGGDSDHAKFLERTAGFPNVVHQRKTSGVAFTSWAQGPVGFVFIDGVHDYANTAFDLDAWSSLTVPGGIVAMHDTDNPEYAGTRRAVFEALPKFDLYAHVDNLVMLRKRG